METINPEVRKRVEVVSDLDPLSRQLEKPGPFL